MQKKILLFHYYPGAGGKFILNCLGHNKGFAIGDSVIAEAMLNKFDILEIQKLMLDTVPARDQMRQWGKYEKYGCRELFGPGIDEIKNRGQLNSNLFPIIDKLASGDYWIPLLSHSYHMLYNLRKFFSKDRVYSVFLDTVPEFIDLAIQRKWPSEHHCLDLDSYRDFLSDTAKIEFDHTIPEWDPRDQTQYHKLITLANNINLEVNLDLAKSYINKYIKIHS